MITGIILAGGKSSRMGTDKCFLKTNNQTFLEKTIKIIEAFTTNILISGENKKFKHLGYDIITDEYKDCGPIGGIFSALKYSKSEVNIIAPCDMPYLNADLFKFLISKLDNYDAVVPIFKDKVEPLIIVLRKRTIDILEEQIKSRKFKILTFIEKINTRFVEINSDLSFYSDYLFDNINKPDDLEHYLKNKT